MNGVVDATIAERRAASRYLSTLAELGVLKEQVMGREKLVIHRK